MPTDPYTHFLFNPLWILNKGLSHAIALESAFLGQDEHGHQAEALVQQHMVKLLLPHLPSPDLIAQNKALAAGLIPDVLVHRIGGGYWGIFELKTLLSGDKLTIEKIERDLEKLQSYKQGFPNIAAFFVLIGSRHKLFNPLRTAAWKNFPLKYDGGEFINFPPKRQPLSNKNWVAIPCGYYDISGVDIVCFMWEIQRTSKRPLRLTSDYQFEARMI